MSNFIKLQRDGYNLILNVNQIVKAIFLEDQEELVVYYSNGENDTFHDSDEIRKVEAALEV